VVTLSYSGSIVPSYGVGIATQNQDLSANVRVPLKGERLFLLGGAAWRRNDPLTNDPYTLRSFWMDTTVGYAIQRRLRIEGFLSSSRQASQGPGGRVGRTTAGVRLATDVPVRFR
jgi:hypothetical protein